MIFLAVIVGIVFSKFLFPQWKREPMDEFLDAVGMSLVLFGFLFRIAGRGYKDEESASGKVLVKNGPYAIIRNPMYFGTFLIGTGIVCVLFPAWIFLIFLLVFLAIYAPQIKKEEAVLLERFGQEYRDYCSRTPRCLPHPLDLLNIQKHLSVRLRWVKKELISLILVILILLAIEIWEDVRLFGYEELFKEFVELFSIVVSFAALVILFGRKHQSLK